MSAPFEKLRRGFSRHSLGDAEAGSQPALAQVLGVARTVLFLNLGDRCGSLQQVSGQEDDELLAADPGDEVLEAALALEDRANWTKAWSPTACPQLSLICLK